MKHFNKFNEHIRQENTELPDGMGWDDMKEGIFNKMEDEPASSLNLSSGYKIPFISLIALTCTISLLLMYLFVKKSVPVTSSTNLVDKKEEMKSVSKEGANNTTIYISTDQKPIDKSTSDVQIGNIKDTKQSNSASNKQSLENRVVTNNAHESISKKIENHGAKHKNETNTFESIDKDYKSNSKTLNQSRETKLNSDYATELNRTQKRSKTSHNSDEISNSEELSLASIKSKSSQVTNLYLDTHNKPIRIGEFYNCTPLPIIKSIAIPNKKSKHFKDLSIDNTPFIKPVSKKLWSFELGSGWNTWNYGLSNNSDQSSLFNNTHSEYGFSYSLRIGRKINNRVSLSSGIDLDYLYKKLDVTYNVLKEKEVKNVLLSYSLNSITAQKSNQVYGDTTVVDTIVKSLIDYNRFQVIQIPLILNYTVYSTSNWEVEAGFGPSISLLTNYNGKYLENDELHIYTNSDNTFNNSPKIALNASLRIRKKFGNNYYLGFRTEFKNHLSSWSYLPKTEMKPKLVSGLITLGKSF